MFQQTMVIGNLGRDPEMRYTTSGQPVCSFSVAHTEKWTDSHGAPQEKTTWFRVSAWGKLAENCNEYLKKGREVMVIGTIDASAYIAKDSGEAKASLELNARTVRFLGGGRKEGDNGNHGGRSRQADPPEIDEEEIPF